MAQLCLWTKIYTKQWFVLSARAFQCMRAGFLCPKCDNFACWHTRQDQNESHLKRWFFFLQNRHLLYLALSETKTYWIVNWLQLLNQLAFVWIHTKVFMQNLSQWRWISGTAGVFSGVRSGVSLWFIDEDANFFHFFHKIRTYGAEGASLLPKSVRNFRLHSATLKWFSK